MDGFTPISQDCSGAGCEIPRHSKLFPVYRRASQDRPPMPYIEGCTGVVDENGPPFKQFAIDSDNPDAATQARVVLSALKTSN